MGKPSTISPSSAEIIAFEPKPQKSERFLRLPHSLLHSLEWRTLSVTERAAFIEVAGRYNGRNNGAIPYSTRELQRELRIRRTKACRIFQVLEEKGHLVCYKRGSFDLKTKAGKEASTWFVPALVQPSPGSPREPTGFHLGTQLVRPGNPAGSTTEPSDYLPGSPREPLIDKKEDSIDYRSCRSSIDKSRTPEKSESSYAVRGGD